MTRPHGILRAGYPYLRTLGMRRITNFPVDVAFGKDNMIYVLCRAEGQALIRVWPIEDMEQQTDDLKGIGNGYRTGDGQLLWPVQIITDADNNVYVTDEAANKVTVFDSNAQFVSKWGKEGSCEGQFDGPTGIALHDDGHLVLVDSKNNRIQRYTTSGEYLGAFGEAGSDPGQLNLPWGVHVDELGDIYVSDWGNNRCQVFDRTGNLKTIIGRYGHGEGEFDRPTGIAVDGHGDIYVADSGNDRVQMFNSEGQYIASFRGDASLSKVARAFMLTNAMSNRLRESGRIEQEKYLRKPRSVRIDDSFRLFIPDYESYRIQVYEKDFLVLDETQLSSPLRNPTLEVT